MKAIRDSLAHGIMGFVGILSGLLSALAFAVAAVAAAVLGVCALVFSPLRVIIDRFRGH